jgi:hypothetical protein
MAQQPQWAKVSSFSRIHDHTHSVGLPWMSDRPDAEAFTWKHTTLTREGHPFPLAGFEPTVPASERLQAHALDRAVTGVSINDI